MTKIARVTVKATGLSEKTFMAQVIDLARLCGYRVYHTHNSMHSPGGFPDLTMVHPGRKELLFVECKSERGRVSEAQQSWISDLRAANQEAYIWRPGDFDTIISRLQAK